MKYQLKASFSVEVSNVQTLATLVDELFIALRTRTSQIDGLNLSVDPIPDGVPSLAPKQGKGAR